MTAATVILLLSIGGIDILMGALILFMTQSLRMPSSDYVLGALILAIGLFVLLLVLLA